MANNSKVITLALSLSFFLLPYCTKHNEGQSNEFYTETKIQDLYRIPLAEPLQLISTVGSGNSWFINLPYGSVAGDEMVPVLFVTVIDSTILFQSDKIYFPKDSEMKRVWFIIDTRKRLQEMYQTEGEFLQELRKRGIKDPMLYDADSLYNQFRKTKRLPYYQE